VISQAILDAEEFAAVAMEIDEDAESRELRRVAAAVAAERYAPLAAQWDAGRVPFPHEERRFLGELGFLGITQSAQHGGGGAPVRQALIVIEELAKVCRPAAFQVFEANVGPAQAVNRLGTPAQKDRYLPAIIRGEMTMAVAISEPDAGSAATDLTTKAVRDGNGYRLTGTKRWISNGGEADLYLAYTRMSEAKGAGGVGALIVRGDAPGISYGAAEKLMGFRGIPSADINFDGVLVPEEDVLVGPGQFGELFGCFSIERLGNATMSLALGQAALDASVAYVTQRRQFGKPIIEFQAVQLMLADMVMQVQAARLLLDRAARGADDGLPDTLDVSIAKCTANEMAKRVTDLAMQVHGGNGYTEEYGLERLHRDAHGWAIAGGTPAIQRVRIVSELLGRRFDQRRLGLACHRYVAGRTMLVSHGAAVWMPRLHGDHARIEEVESGEERGDLRLAARHVVDSAAPSRLCGLGRLLRVHEVRGQMRDGEIAARRQDVDQRSHDVLGIVVVSEEVQEGYQHEGDRLIKVKDAVQCRVIDDLAGLAEVRQDERGGAGPVAGHQRPRVREDDRVVVHVDDPAVRRHRLCYLMGVARGGDPGADVEELPDARFPGQVADNTAEEGAVLPGEQRHRRNRRRDRVADLPVGGEVILAAQPVVVHPGGMRHPRVDLGREPVRILRGSVLCLAGAAAGWHRRLLGVS
jgi:butyryl-CoA dehydrogenase